MVILGPTAVGKTNLSIRLAEHLGGEIVSADSRLLYRGMDIGTAKPTLSERNRVPHHLIDIADPDETWSLPMFQKAAKDAIEAIHQSQRLPMLVGGTGQYIRSITQGWEPPRQVPQARLRDVIEQWGQEIGTTALHIRLSLIDPAAARNIEPNNLRRIVRALEVIFMTGRRFSEQRQRSPTPYHVLQLGLSRPREELYSRLDSRIDQMLASGWLAEVQNLLYQGYSRQLPSMSAIGYRQLAGYLAGELTLEAAIVEIRRLTRQFVRRQANWFKADDPAIHWFTAGPETLTGMAALIQATFRDDE